MGMMDEGIKISLLDHIWPHAQKPEDSECYQGVIMIKTCHAKEITTFSWHRFFMQFTCLLLLLNLYCPVYLSHQEAARCSAISSNAFRKPSVGFF